MDSLIIDRPSRQSLAQKYVDNSLKVIMLLGWLYLCLPAITFGVWYIAYTFFNQHIILLEGYKEYKSITSVWYLVIIANMVVLVLAWSKGNQLFHKEESATHADVSLTDREINDYYGVPETDIHHLRSMKNVTVSFDANGAIVKTEGT